MRGDRVAVLGRGIAVVEQIDGEWIQAVVWNKRTLKGRSQGNCLGRAQHAVGDGRQRGICETCGCRKVTSESPIVSPSPLMRLCLIW